MSTRSRPPAYRSPSRVTVHEHHLKASLGVRAALLTVSLALLAPLAQGQTSKDEAQNGGRKPLFPVALKHPLPDAEKSFNDVRELILKNYYSATITEEALYRAAIDGMLRHISPPKNRSLATLWSPEEYQRILSSLTATRLSAGIKSTLNRGDASLTVGSILPGSPADGLLQPFDRIVRINDRPLTGMDPKEIDSLLSGEAGDTVRLTVVRDVKVIHLDMVIRQFGVKNLAHGVLPDGVGYIAIKKITKDSGADLKAKLAELLADGVSKAIIDLRGNGGGVFIEGLRMAELFLAKNQVMLHTVQAGDKIQRYVSANDSPLQMKLVVLVDSDTASSSEIFAGALQAHGLAALVGTTTRGKATMEKTFTLENGHRVKFIIGALFEPRGTSWHESGLRPDFQIAADKEQLKLAGKLPLAARVERDAQLRAAWQLLR